MTINNENLLIRAASKADLDQLLAISTQTGAGMTTMPTDRQAWVDKLTRSEQDFNSDHPAIDSDVYFLVLEDLNNNKVIGSGAFYAGIGLNQPFYSYKLSSITTSSKELEMTMQTRVLNLVNDYTNTTEIGSLFLLPEYRRDGIGKFLSRARFMLLADFPERFNETIIAEMRGWVDEHDESPFWEHLGRKFFGLSFTEADFISAVDGSQFISDLMPKFPVYLDLLPQQAQDVVGKPNDSAAGALAILKKEGFRFNNYIDIFDAGPTIEAKLSEIKTIKNSQTHTYGNSLNDQQLSELNKQNDQLSNSYLISNGQRKNFRVVRSKIMINDSNQVCLPPMSANSLQINTGDQIRISPLSV